MGGQSLAGCRGGVGPRTVLRGSSRHGHRHRGVCDVTLAGTGIGAFVTLLWQAQAAHAFLTPRSRLALPPGSPSVRPGCGTVLNFMMVLIPRLLPLPLLLLNSAPRHLPLAPNSLATPQGCWEEGACVHH